MTSSLKDIVETLEQSPTVSYVVDANFQIAYCNPAWDRFAEANDAPELVRGGILGLDLRQVLGDDLRPYYLRAFEEAAKNAKVWECLYECSSPEHFRKFHMRVHPLQPQNWFLITNALVIEQAHTAPATGKIDDYLDSNFNIAMCSHCRCTRRVLPPERWDFVPAHLNRHLTNITHSLCPLCLEYFYPKDGD